MVGPGISIPVLLLCKSFLVDIRRRPPYSLIGLVSIMRAIIRADSSSVIGTGHIMRCLTLADYMRQNGGDVKFICRDLPGNIVSYIQSKNYPVILLDYEQSDPSPLSKYEKWLGITRENDCKQCGEILSNEDNIDWLIVDHYALDERWEAQLRKYVKNIMAIDDLANRGHDCDILLDQNLHIDMEERYCELVSESCRQLLGPRERLRRSVR